MVNKQPPKPRPSPERGLARIFTPMRTAALAVCALSLVIGAIAYFGSGREETRKALRECPTSHRKWVGTTDQVPQLVDNARNGGIYA